MLAISVSQPWSWLICHAAEYPNGKDVENRGWNTHYRGSIAIHAPLKVDEAFFLDQGLRYTAWAELPKGALEYAPAYRRDYKRGGIVGVAELIDVVKESDSPWFVGPFGWVLRDARPVPFVRVPGQPWLFEVPNSLIVLEEV